MRYIPSMIFATLAISAVLGIGPKVSAWEKGERSARQPNLLIDISAAAVNRAVQRTVDRVEPFEETIQDTPVEGIGRTRGLVWAELVPNAKCAAIDVVFRGQTDSRSVGIRPQTLIHTVGTTVLDVRRGLTVDGNGIHSTPKSALGLATTNLLDVTNRYGDFGHLQIEFARRGFLRSQAAAEIETGGKTAQTLSDRMGTELAAPLGSVSELARKGLSGLQKKGLGVESLEFASSAEFVNARVKFAVPGTIAGPTPAMPRDIDLGVRVHQTLVNAAARAVYGGRSFRVEEVADFYEEVSMGLLANESNGTLRALSKLIATLALEPMTITLAKKDPLSVTFGDQGFVVDAHIVTIRHGRTNYAGTRVRAAYKLENSWKGVHAVRKGPVQILVLDPPTDEEPKLESPPAYFYFFAELLASQVMKERFTVNVTPTTDALPDVRFLPPRAGASDGWFGIAWSLAGGR